MMNMENGDSREMYFPHKRYQVDDTIYSQRTTKPVYSKQITRIIQLQADFHL